MNWLAIFWFSVAGLQVLILLGIAVVKAARIRERRAQKRMERLSVLRAQAISRRRPALEPLDPSETTPLRVRLEHMPRDN